MHGNLWEWCLDPWNNNYEGDLNDGSVWDDENKDNIYHNILDSINILIKDPRKRIVRGGSWSYHPRICRSACRSYRAFGLSNVGFRPAFSL